VVSTGCYKATFIRDSSAVRGVEHDEWTNFFLFGLVNEQILALCATGCFRTTVKSGLPMGHAPIEYDNKWHGGLVSGIVELSGPYDLSKVCPKGWAAIHTETSFLNGLVQGITLNIYSPQSITITCAAR
jgi:hypothetical protein